MRDVVADLAQWRAEGRRFAVATVVATGGSAPRPIGAKMAVDAQGRVAGAVSGGCVEGAVVELAAEVLATGRSRTAEYGISDDEAWDVGLPCGGRIEVHVAPWDVDDAPAARFATLAGDPEARAALVTAIDDPGACPRRLLVLPDGAAEGSLGDQATTALGRDLAADLLWAERSATRQLGATRVLVDVIAPAPRLVLVGAPPLSQALCRAARTLDWVPFVIDPRSRFATRERLPDAERVVVGWPERGFAEIGGLDRATALVALSHDPKIDDPALVAAVRAGVRFVGAMGSRRATADRRARLVAAGLTDAEVARIAAPVGLDLGNRGDAETALSILAEIVASGHGRDGGRLASAAGPIHVPEPAAPAARPR